MPKRRNRRRFYAISARWSVGAWEGRRARNTKLAHGTRGWKWRLLGGSKETVSDSVGLAAAMVSCRFPRHINTMLACHYFTRTTSRSSF